MIGTGVPEADAFHTKAAYMTASELDHRLDHFFADVREQSMFRLLGNNVAVSRRPEAANYFAVKNSF